MRTFRQARPQMFAKFSLVLVAPVTLAIVTGEIALAADDASDAKLVSVEPYVFEAMGQQIDAEYGWIDVPENRAGETNARIQLPFVRFAATGPDPGPPLVYLAGGPGGSGIGTGRSERFHMFMKLREAGDVILFDQRGTGNAKPDLSVPTKFEFPLDHPADLKAWTAIAQERAQVCRNYIEDQGIDLDSYTTVASAADVNALRRALGLETINLWGTSYGTHLSFAVVRYHGEGVNRVIMSGVEGPDHTLKLPSTIESQLDAVSELIEHDPAFREHIPDLKALIERLLEDLDANPRSIDLGSAGTIVVGKTDLQLFLSQAVGRLTTLRLIPRFLYTFSNGDYTALGRLVHSYRDYQLRTAMSWMMDCASGATPERLERIEREAQETLLGDVVNFPVPHMCAGLGHPDLGAEFRGPLHSDVPVLFISGSLDARTPSTNVDDIIDGFPNGQRLLVVGAGHDEMLFSKAPGLDEAMLAFLREKPLPTTRIELPPIEFARLPTL